MKNPNGFGSVIKLSGKRRRPFAVRISSVEEKEGVFRQKFIYLDYFEKRKDALQYLSEYNSGFEVKKTPRIEESPTFEEVYEMFGKFRASVGKPLNRNYTLAYNRVKPLHKLKIRNITIDKLQEVLLESETKSRGTVQMIKTLIKGVYKYCMQRDLVDKDLSQYLEMKYTENEEDAHTRFTDEEIKKLWAHKDDKDVFVILILMYTGMRISELLEIRTENIHLSERYMIGGIKTEAGRNRTIPIAEKLVPFFEEHLNPNNELFLLTKTGKPYSYINFVINLWPKLMNRLGMNHKTHDCRVTCATLLKKAKVDDLHRKLILGHSIQDLTDRVYTKVDLSELIKDINKI